MKPSYVRTIIHLALAEDLGAGDITTDHLVPRTSKARARLVSKSQGIICGLNLAALVFKVLSPQVKFVAKTRDGQAVRPNQILAEISGPTRALLSGERVALNFISMLSGIATQTSHYVKAVKPYKTKILDTRKTIPLLRQLQRYAVSIGGGENHRFNLNDMVMIKDNHRPFTAGRMNETIEYLKKKTSVKIEVEVDTLEQFKSIINSKADIVLLDNMSPKQIAKVVKIKSQSKARFLLEASGGITLKNVRQYAAAGVDRISIGALTHSLHALDISMEII